MGCVVLVLGSALPAGAEDGDEDGRRIQGPVAASLIKVRDGDTLEVDAHIWPAQTVRVAVRLRGIDAPELKAKCDHERAAAEAARDRLSALVGEQRVELLDVSGDKYFGRVLARISVPDEPDVGRRLLDEGYVAAYDGGRRRDWCDGNAKLSSLSR